MQVTLRPWTAEDAGRLARLGNNPNIAANMTNTFPSPFLEEMAGKFIQNSRSESPERILAITCDGEVCGSIGLYPLTDIYARNAELGYWIGESFWGKGIATRAVRQMVDYGFHHFPFDRIFARPFGSNHASQKVLEKAGFLLEARFSKTILKAGQYQDELVYAVRKPDIA